MLFERSTQLRQLIDAAEAAEAGRGSITLLYGEAGIGKTSLLQEFRQAVSPSIRVLWGGCDALYTPRPFGPLHDMGGDLGDDIQTLLQNRASVSQLLEALLNKLECSEESAAFVFEDVHWADNATLDVLKALGRRIRLMNALLIMTYRDDEVGPTHPLGQVIGDIPQANIQRISLSSLSENAVGRLDEKGVYDREELHRITGGNPFFVTEMLAAQQSPSEALPASVTDSINARLNRLSDKEQTFLETISVMPASINRDIVRALFGAEGEILAMACVGRNLLVADGRGQWRFRHEIARLATLERLPPFQKQEAHNRVFHVLSTEAMNTPLDVLVHHAAGALLGTKVLELAPAAARIAIAIGAHRQAVDHLGTALRFVDEAEPTLAAELYEQWAYEASLALQIDDDVIEARRHAISLWRALDRPEKVGDNLRWLSRLHWYKGEAAEADHFAQEAVRILESVEPSVERAMAYSFQSQLHMLNDRMEEAIEWGERAMTLADSLDNDEIRAHALNNVGTARAFRDDPIGVDMLYESLEIALKGDLHEHAARVYTNLSCYAVEYREFSLADRVISEGIAFDTKHDLDAWTHYLVGVLAQLRLEQGSPQDAAKIAKGVLTLDRLTLVMTLPAKIALSRALMRQGDAAAKSILAEALSDAIATDEVQYIVPGRLSLIEHAWLNDDSKSAHDQLAALEQINPKFIHSWHDGERRLWARRTGFESNAAAATDLPAPVRLELMGRPEEAAQKWLALDSPYAAALVFIAHAEVAPGAFLKSALKILDPMGANSASQKARQLATKFRVRNQMPRHRRGPYRVARNHPLGLTRKEQIVLELLATGATNQEISKAMARSRRTIEHHVSSVLAKLHVSNRMEAMLRIQNEPWILAAED